MIRQIRFRIESRYLSPFKPTEKKALEAAAMHDDGGASCAARFDQLALSQRPIQNENPRGTPKREQVPGSGVTPGSLVEVS
jgi:hypothetical protein